MLENAAARELSARSAHGLDGDVRRDVVPAGGTRTYTKAMAYVLADQRGGGGRWAPGQVLDGGLFDVAFLDQAMPMPQVQRMTDFAWPMTVDREDVETSELVGFDERPERGVTPLAEARSGPNLILAVARETASRASPVIPR